MTVVVACRFTEGAVLLADSRATWIGPRTTYQDALQKILPLGGKQALVYAGDVGAAGLVVRELRRRIRANNRLLIPRKAALEIPRIARHYYAVYRARHRDVHPLAMVFTGVSAGGKIEIWWYQSPNFEAHQLEKGCVTLGSGADAARKFIGRSLPTL